MKLKKNITRFRKELRKEIRLAVAAAIGFLIAFAWKDYVFALAKNILGSLSIVMPNMSNFLIALVLTIIGVLLLLISSRFLE